MATPLDEVGAREACLLTDETQRLWVDRTDVRCVGEEVVAKCVPRAWIDRLHDQHTVRFEHTLRAPDERDQLVCEEVFDDLDAYDRLHGVIATLGEPFE